jgi:hypothetical protein
MSIEAKIEALTEALDRNTAAILSSIGASAPAATVGKADAPAETKPAAAKKPAAKKSEPKAEEPVQQPDDSAGEEARAELIKLLTVRFAKGNGTAEKNRKDAEAIKAIYADYKVEKAGDLPADKAAEALERVRALLDGEASEDDGESLI